MNNLEWRLRVSLKIQYHCQNSSLKSILIWALICGLYTRRPRRHRKTLIFNFPSEQSRRNSEKTGNVPALFYWICCSSVLWQRVSVSFNLVWKVPFCIHYVIQGGEALIPVWRVSQDSRIVRFRWHFIPYLSRILLESNCLFAPYRTCNVIYRRGLSRFTKRAWAIEPDKGSLTAPLGLDSEGKWVWAGG